MGKHDVNRYLELYRAGLEARRRARLAGHARPFPRCDWCGGAGCTTGSFVEGKGYVSLHLGCAWPWTEARLGRRFD